MSINTKPFFASTIQFFIPVFIISTIYFIYNINYTGLVFNHDAAWYSDAIHRFYNGKILYRDIIDMTPPYLYFFLYPEYILSEKFKLSGFSAHSIYVGSMIFLSCLMTWFCIDDLSPQKRMVLISIVIIAFTFGPSADFGQREHIFAIMATPWVILNITNRKRNNFLYFTSTLMITSAILIKPYFITPILTVATIRFFEKKSIKEFFNIEFLFMALSYVVYIIFIKTIFPEYFLYMSKFIFFSYYSFSTNFYTIFSNSIIAIIPLCSIAILAGLKSPQSRRAIVISLSFISVYAIQMRGWTYEIAQGEIIALIACSLILLQSNYKKTAIFIILSALSVSYSYRNFTFGLYKMNVTPGLISYTQNHTHPGDRIYYLSEHVSHQYPLIPYFGLVSTSRMAHQWILPGAYLKTQDQHAPEYQEASEIYKLAQNTNINDIISQSPQFIYVYHGVARPYFHNIPYDYIAEMSRSPRFKDFIAQYQKTYEDESFSVYTRDRATLRDAQ